MLFSSLENSMVVSFVNTSTTKRMVKHGSSKYGWHIYNRCFRDECRKQGKYKQLDVVCFDHKSFSQQKLKCKLHVFCLAPKVTAQPIQYL